MAEEADDELPVIVEIFSRWQGRPWSGADQ